MTTSTDLPEDVRRLIETLIPSLEALEIVLVLARDPGREWQASVIVPLLYPTVVSESVVDDYLHELAHQGLLDAGAQKRFTYAPSTPELARAVEGLIVAYHQRPVTLVRTVFSTAHVKRIQTLADAFRLRKV